MRNAYFSFQVVVRSEKPESYFLFVGENPPNVLQSEAVQGEIRPDTKARGFPTRWSLSVTHTWSDS